MQTDILIIGGGLSGLALADRLERAGADYLLLEARDRLGGRILSQEVGGAQFDLGPAWFWPDQPLMAELVERLDLGVFEQYSSGDIASEDRQGTVHRRMGLSSMQGTYRVKGGFGALDVGLSRILSSQRIRLESRVVSLSWAQKEVIAKVISGAGESLVRAKRVVLAVPPRVAVSNIAFNPSLPEAAADALAAIPTWMAGQAKILAIYDRPHWREAGLSGDAMSQKGPMVEIHDASPADGGPYALFGFVGFPVEVRHSHRTEMMGMAKEQLVRLFGAKMLNPTALNLQDWAQQDLTATKADNISDSYHPAYRYPQAARGLWEDQLLLGSTEVASEFGGFLEGALVAARDAALTIVQPVRNFA